MRDFVRRGPRRAWLAALLALPPCAGAWAEEGKERPPPKAAPDLPADPDLEDAPAPLLARIDAAIAKGVLWLRNRPTTEGTWGDAFPSGGTTYDGTKDGYPCPYGPTALALYALLKCGVPKDDPVVKKGFAWLKKNDRLGGTAYEVSMKLLAATATADPFQRHADSSAAGEKVRLAGEMRSWADDLAVKLLKMRSPQGWRYWGPGDRTAGGPQDLSSTQLATLALFAADRGGIRVPAEAWSGIVSYALDQQEVEGPAHPRAVFARPPKGAKAPPAPGGTTAGKPAGAEGAVDAARGFVYAPRAPDVDDRTASGGMTACGVGCLMTARFALMSRHPKVWAKTDAARVQQAVYDGLAWLDLHWSPFENPIGNRRWDVYYLYCVERAMDLTGGQRLGKRLWYVEMAERLLPRQRENGAWPDGEGLGSHGEVLDTCFALLFLRRATRGGIPFPSVTGGSDEPAADGR